jgi:hypothetical protein
MPVYVVPPALRSARFVPRQQPGRREPARVSAGAFRSRALPVPEHPGQLNIYQLTQRGGLPWSPGVDAWIGRRGGELLGSGELLCADCDTALAVDGTVWLDGFRRLADLASESGNVLDLSGCIAVRTPGHDAHGQGWHLWWRADPGCPVRLGPLSRCPLIEIKARCTAPGTPGYPVRSVSDGDLDVLPRWLAELAGPPRTVTVPGRHAGGGRTWERLEGVVSFLLEAGPGDGRNGRLYWASCRCAEMVAAGDLDAMAAEQVLFSAAEDNGHVAKHGPAATRATIASGLRAGAAA